MSDQACAECGRDPAAGYARGYDGRRLCHPDPALRPDETGPDCYHLTQGRPGTTLADRVES